MSILIVPKEVQDIVEEYLVSHAQLKKLEKKVKQMRAVIEPYMKENNIEELYGVRNLGKIQLAEQDRPLITSQYTYYNASQIMPMLPMEAKRNCIVHLIDKEKLEALAELDIVSKDLLNYRLLNRISLFKVLHTV